MSFINRKNKISRKQAHPFHFSKPNERPDLSGSTVGNESIQPPRELFEVLIQHASGLQMLPDVAARAVKVAEDPESNIKDLVAIIAQDVMLTTNILALSNSALLGASQETSSLQTAVTRLGFRQTKNMILSSCFARMLKRMEWEEVMVRDALCRHSFFTATICSQLNSIFRLGMQGEEFTAGLVHDVGRLLLAVAVPDQFKQMDPLDFCEDENLLDNEFEAIGTTHAEIGAWFLQRNHLPDELVTVARYHHNPKDASMYLRLVGLVAVADELANHFGRGSLEDFSIDRPSLKLLESLGVESAGEVLAENWREVLAFSNQEVSSFLNL